MDANPNSTQKYMRYFIYSVSQMKINREMSTRLGKELVLGTVMVNGEQKTYTEITTDLKNVRYSDAEIVAYGDIRKMNYTIPK